MFISLTHFKGHEILRHTAVQDFHRVAGSKTDRVKVAGPQAPPAAYAVIQVNGHLLRGFIKGQTTVGALPLAAFELGGKPFLTDCNTMYPGSRKNALEHLECAWQDGFTALEGGVNFRLSVVVLLALTGPGAAAHADVLDGSAESGHFRTCPPTATATRKTMCRSCQTWGCSLLSTPWPWIRPVWTPAWLRRPLIFSAAQPDFLGVFQAGAPFGLRRRVRKVVMMISFASSNAVKVLNCRMAEYTKAVVDGRPQFHISLVVDVSPNPA